MFPSLIICLIIYYADEYITTGGVDEFLSLFERQNIDADEEEKIDKSTVSYNQITKEKPNYWIIE